jgi:hypothetical protein
VILYANQSPLLFNFLLRDVNCKSLHWNRFGLNVNNVNDLTEFYYSVNARRNDEKDKTATFQCVYSRSSVASYCSPFYHTIPGLELASCLLVTFRHDGALLQDTCTCTHAHAAAIARQLLERVPITL